MPFNPFAASTMGFPQKPTFGTALPPTPAAPPPPVAPAPPPTIASGLGFGHFSPFAMSMDQLKQREAQMQAAHDAEMQAKMAKAQSLSQGGGSLFGGPPQPPAPPPGVSGMDTGSSGMGALSGLGDSIKAKVQASLAGQNRPTPGAFPGMRSFGASSGGPPTFGAPAPPVPPSGMPSPAGKATSPAVPSGGPPTTTEGTLPPPPPVSAPASPDLAASPGGFSPAQTPAPTPPEGGGGTLGSAGNPNVDQYDATFIEMGQKYGVDPADLKAMAMIESPEGQYDANGNVITRDDGFGDGLSVGVMQVKPDLWQSLAPGADPNTPEGNIELGAALMAQAIQQEGSVQGAITGVYFPSNDPNGTTQSDYVAQQQAYRDQIQAGSAAAPAPIPPAPPGDVAAQPIPNAVPTTGDATQLAAPVDAAASGMAAPTTPDVTGGTGAMPVSPAATTIPPGEAPAATGDPVTDSIVSESQQFVGVAYNWGALPNAHDDPWSTGWDCSGFTQYLDSQYGNGNVPYGSHYQYQAAAEQGILKTDQSQLQPGDLLFYDTGWMAGGGSDLNRAGHVAMYIGNGQVIQAANPDVGTIITPLDQMSGTFMGAAPIEGYAPSQYA